MKAFANSGTIIDYRNGVHTSRKQIFEEKETMIANCVRPSVSRAICSHILEEAFAQF